MTPLLDLMPFGSAKAKQWQKETSYCHGISEIEISFNQVFLPND